MDFGSVWTTRHSNLEDYENINMEGVNWLNWLCFLTSVFASCIKALFLFVCLFLRPGVVYFSEPQIPFLTELLLQIDKIPALYHCFIDTNLEVY